MRYKPVTVDEENVSVGCCRAENLVDDEPLRPLNHNRNQKFDELFPKCYSNVTVEKSYCNSKNG